MLPPSLCGKSGMPKFKAEVVVRCGRLWRGGREVGAGRGLMCTESSPKEPGGGLGGSCRTGNVAGSNGGLWVEWSRGANVEGL